jgi:predicted ABC-type ATPase
MNKHIITPIQEGVEDFGIFKAIIMAGSPGSGKSTVRQELFGGTGLKLVDVDEIRAAYLKLKKPGDYETFGHIAKKQGQSYTDQRLGIILDRTAWWLPSIQNTVHELRSIGYDVGMVQVFTPLHVALDRVTERALRTGRDVPVPEVVKRYHGLQENTRAYIDMFGDAYWFVDNSHARPHVQLIKRDVRNWLRSPPQSEQARAWIDSQRVAKLR